MVLQKIRGTFFLLRVYRDMKRKIPLFRILVASAVLFSAASVFAEPPGPPPEEGGMFGPGNPREFGKLMDELKLTDAQRAKVKAQHEATKTDAKKYHEQLKPMHEELRALLEANTVDLKAVRAKLQSISNVQLELRMIHIKGRLDFESVLTPDQKAQLKKITKERMDKMREHHGENRPHRGPGAPECER